MSPAFEEALDESLDALLRGESVGRCLDRYPQHAKELEPLLLMAQTMIESSGAESHPELKSETRRTLGLSLQASQVDTQFQDALSHCIDLLYEGQSVKRCLDLYPNYAQALEPLLQIAASLQQAFTIEARAGYKRASRKRILSSIKRGRGPGWLPSFLQPKWTFRGAVALSAFLVVFLIGAGAVRASSDSMPDDLLYPVKEFTEKVQLKLPRSNSAEAKLHIKLANRRAHEMAAMVREGDYDKVEELIGELGDHLEKVPVLVQQNQKDAAIKMVFQAKGPEPGESLGFDEVRALLETLDQDIRENAAIFKEVLQGSPPDMQVEFKQALQEANKYYSETIQALEFKRSTDELGSLRTVARRQGQ